MSKVLDKIKFKCKSCGYIEYIPKKVVDSLDSLLGRPNFPPTFSCENCHSGSMYPIDYKSPKGIVYKYDD